MALFYYAKNVTNLSKLHTELAVILSTNLKGVSSQPNQIIIDTLNDMSQAERDAVVVALEGFVETDPLQIVKTRILNAMAFGTDVMAEFGARNVLKGYSIAQINQVSMDLVVLQQLCLSGSLYCALDFVVNFTPTTLLTQADKDYFAAKIRAYLGIVS